METIVLIVHLLLALALIGVVLLQRSEGSALLSGGGAITGRPPTTPLAKLTWGLAAAFIATSIALTIIAAREAAGVSVVDRLGDDGGGAAPAEAPAVPAAEELLPPPVDGAPAPPPRAD
jgi:preprotein translocase subunit SecG